MNPYLKRWIRKIKYFIFYGLRPVIKLISIDDITFSIVLHPIKNGGTDIVLFNKGVWEPQVTKYLKKYLKKGDVFVDVGANIGYHSLFVAKHLDGDCEIHAFEPQKDLCKQLINSLEINKISCVKVYDVGLSNVAGDCEMVIRDENIGSSSLIEFKKENPLVVSDRQMVSVKKMDDVLADLSKVSLIKIDVEGLEYNVFLGAEQTIKKYNPVILFEYSPFLYKAIDNDLPLKILRYLESLGYVFFDIIDEKPFLLDSDLFSKEQRDLLCIKK